MSTLFGKLFATTKNCEKVILCKSALFISFRTSSLFSILLFASPVWADLPSIITTVKPSVVAIATLLRTRSPQILIRGTGFVVGDGLHFITNAHVMPKASDLAYQEKLTVLSGFGKTAKVIKVTSVAEDKVHDLALLKFSGTPLKPLQLAAPGTVREGVLYAFTGFPIGAILGVYPVTHRGIVSAITPIVIPVTSSRRLNPELIKRLRDPYMVFQLDATAYPGNSGSPMYEIDTGNVVGVINKVFVKESKESVLQKPSGISYAIPGRYVRELLKKAGF